MRPKLARRKSQGAKEYRIINEKCRTVSPTSEYKEMEDIDKLIK